MTKPARKSHPPLNERFWSKVDRRGPDECWPWLSWSNPKGYGRFKLNGRNWLATHCALLLVGRPRPDNFACAMHSCDNPACVNPAHLRWATVAENNADRDAKGRAVHLVGEDHFNSILTEEAVIAARLADTPGKQLARELGVSATTVQRARVGAGWRHVSVAPQVGGVRRGERSTSAKLTDADVAAIMASDEPSRLLGARFGVSPSNIDRIRRGEQWSHLGMSAARSGQVKGEKIWQAKLDADMVRQIRASPLSHKAAAQAFGISPSVVCRVRARKAWAHVD